VGWRSSWREAQISFKAYQSLVPPTGLIAESDRDGSLNDTGTCSR